MGTFDQAPTSPSTFDSAPVTDPLVLVFQQTLNLTCDVYEKGQGTVTDPGGQPLPGLTKLVTGVKCRKSTTKSGKEWEVGKKYAENDYVIYMMPITVDDLSRPFRLSARHWLKVYDTDGNVTTLNLKAVNDVNDPSTGAAHHLEARGTEIVA